MTCATDAMVANGSSAGRRASPTVIVSALMHASVMPVAAKRPGSRRPDQPLGICSAQQVMTRFVSWGSGAVDGVHRPVAVDDGDPAAGPGHAHELRKRGLGPVQVLEHSLAVGAVEAPVGEVEAGDVATAELDGQRRVGAAAFCFGGHRVTGVYADHAAAGCECRREAPGHVPGATPGVQQPAAGCGGEELDSAGPKLLDRWQAGLNVKGGDERGTVGVSIDRTEASVGGGHGCGAHARVAVVSQAPDS